MATFTASFDSITDTAATFSARFSGGDSSYSRYRYVNLEIDGRSFEIKSTRMGGSSSSFEKKITRLDPDTKYSWYAKVGYESSGNIYWLDLDDSGSFRTDPAPIEVTPWSWTKSNGEATTTQTRTAYDVLHGNAEADQFSHYVWNDLVAKVLEMRVAKGDDWSIAGGKYLTSDECRVRAGDTLTAEIYNAVRYNIGFFQSTGIYDQNPGDPITGYKIYHLTEVLNDIINGL